MASKVMNIIIALVLVVVALLWNEGEAQSNCMTTLVGLTPCMNYVTGNSTTPSSTCCTALSSVVQSNPQCLCSLVNSGGSGLGIPINQTLALALPAACNVQTPPVSQCNAANGPSPSVPASSPSSSPAPTGSSDNTPQIPATPSGSGSTGTKTGTSRNGSSNAGSSNIKISFSLMGFIVFIVSSALA